MIDIDQRGFLFQTFFISKETSKCPYIVDIIKLCKKIDDFGLIKKGSFSISLTYGKRILINAKDFDVKNIQKHDIVEIVDYDPIKGNILVIGRKDPCIETPVHWIIHKARSDINAVIQISNEKLFERFCDELPITKKEEPQGTIELAKEVLRTLRESKLILIKNVGLLLIGFKRLQQTNSVFFRYQN